MSSLNSHPQNLPWVSPYITVRDVAAAATFYQQAFKFSIGELVKGEDGSYWHGELSYNQQLIMLGKEGAWGGTSQSPITSQVESPMNLYVYCADIDAFYQAALAANALAVVEPQDMFWGDRMAKLKDLDGYTWAFATCLKRA